MKTSSLLPAVVSLVLITCQSNQNEISLATITPREMCGTVQFSDGCGEALDSSIAYGIALIHHMTFEEAEAIFDEVRIKDPDCFWGHWGRAMSFIHPLWPDQPSAEQLQEGLQLAQKAVSLARKDREKAFGKALLAYYTDGASKTEKARLASMEMMLKDAYEKRPGDTEIAAFYAVAMLSTVPPEDKSYTKQQEAGAIAESIIKVIPDHPGAFHYAIHANDFPPLAEKAILVARNYGKIAPEIPHALHMPSHIFTRRGLWQESIEWNSRSSAAAIKRIPKGEGAGHNLHALDYLVYANLQIGKDQEAEKIREQVDRTTVPFQDIAACAYALAAIPARLFLEREMWKEAAALPFPVTEFPWQKYPQYEALHHFARGIGAARSSQPAIAGEALQQLVRLFEQLGDKPENAYWRTQIDIKKKAVEAWLALARGQKEEALRIMQASAALETSTDKNPVTPGELLPANELLGDMLLELNQPAEALMAYQKSLTDAPNRYRTYLGAAMAAEQSGNPEKARKYYQDLVKLASPDCDRASLEMAREKLEKVTI
jgi:tetratricopeptide (TPR) repeat protein